MRNINDVDRTRHYNARQEEDQERSGEDKGRYHVKGFMILTKSSTHRAERILRLCNEPVARILAGVSGVVSEANIDNASSHTDMHSSHCMMSSGAVGDEEWW